MDVLFPFPPIFLFGIDSPFTLLFPEEVPYRRIQKFSLFLE